MCFAHIQDFACPVTFYIREVSSSSYPGSKQFGRGLKASPEDRRWTEARYELGTGMWKSLAHYLNEEVRI